jgi:hypothetical protein
VPIGVVGGELPVGEAGSPDIGDEAAEKEDVEVTDVVDS